MEEETLYRTCMKCGKTMKADDKFYQKKMVQKLIYVKIVLLCTSTTLIQIHFYEF